MPENAELDRLFCLRCERLGSQCSCTEDLCEAKGCTNEGMEWQYGLHVCGEHFDGEADA